MIGLIRGEAALKGGCSSVRKTVIRGSSLAHPPFFLHLKTVLRTSAPGYKNRNGSTQDQDPQDSPTLGRGSNPFKEQAGYSGTCPWVM